MLKFKYFKMNFSPSRMDYQSALIRRIADEKQIVSCGFFLKMVKTRLPLHDFSIVEATAPK